MTKKRAEGLVCFQNQRPSVTFSSKNIVRDSDKKSRKFIELPGKYVIAGSKAANEDPAESDSEHVRFIVTSDEKEKNRTATAHLSFWQ